MKNIYSYSTPGLPRFGPNISISGGIFALITSIHLVVLPVKLSLSETVNVTSYVPTSQYR